MLFELISARYERRSMLITANQPFGEWGKIFPDPAMTLAAVDRLVHHATIFEMNVESYRRRDAIERRTRRRPAANLRDNQDASTIDAPRQSNRTLDPCPRQSMPRIITTAATIRFSSRLSRASHPDCRATRWR